LSGYTAVLISPHTYVSYDITSSRRGYRI